LNPTQASKKNYNPSTKKKKKKKKQPKVMGGSYENERKGLVI
jgi:hypothetical protein